MSAPFTYWQEGEFWIGFWNDYPDHTTQGYSFEELKDMLIDLRQIILSTPRNMA